MSSQSRGLAVVADLRALITEIKQSLNDVPGSDRLVRACTKELHHFTQLPPTRLDNAATCSNLPHFKAIVRLAQAYGQRVTGMLCRFRMPPPTGDTKAPATVSISSNAAPKILGFTNSSTVEDDSDFLRKKAESVVVDLVCVQNELRPTISRQPSHRKSREHCPGNATDADRWAPSLWIKVVTRDATRLNTAWLGEASSHRAACLYRQMEDFVTTASWYQRGQPSNWIRSVIHWIPSTNPDPATLDAELLRALTHLNVCFIPSELPWRSSCLPSVSDSPGPECTSEAARQTLSLKKHMYNPSLVRSTLLSTGLRSKDLNDRCDLVSKLDEILHNTFVHTDDSEGEPKVERFPIRTPLDAILHQSIGPPFSRNIYEKLDDLPRVNLDVSAMIAMVSELSQFIPNTDGNSSSPVDVADRAHAMLEALTSDGRREQLSHEPRFTCKTLDWLLESEAECSVLLSIHDFIRGSVILVCRTAALSFLRILVTVAGVREWSRGVQLLSRLVIVPDLVLSDSLSAVASKQAQSKTLTNRQKTQLIMDVGNAFGALTVTSNEAFLRSLRNMGLKHAALLIPARALTETAERATTSTSDPHLS